MNITTVTIGECKEKVIGTYFRPLKEKKDGIKNIAEVSIELFPYLRKNINLQIY